MLHLVVGGVEHFHNFDQFSPRYHKYSRLSLGSANIAINVPVRVRKTTTRQGIRNGDLQLGDNSAALHNLQNVLNHWIHIKQRLIGLF